ncbi:histidinol-phosphatase [Salinigranum rubrum]|uniref:Histidinol-phosphatase n=1 Tax=Salinigranum rubrum TaxID=755307 RepID=A0A2I8VKS4_9EURY|nr:PHP domain-containing protein [Salinigranum rubrum]AUV82530.1 histidinol-phosphatase [Salinigranum rubrum]
MTRRYDLQVHTDASPCSDTAPRAVVTAAVEAGLDGIAITDHDTVENTAVVERLAPASFNVISGVEVTTTQGHLLALDVEAPPPQTTPVEVIEWIHDHGGVAVLSHPFDTLRQYYTENLQEIATLVDAVEGINSRCVFPQFNRRAQSFAVAHSLPITGGSDAHFPREVGRAYTKCEGDLIDSIRSNEVRACGRGGYLSGHVATKIHQARTALSR